MKTYDGPPRRPTQPLALTMGCPVGIGPELVVRCVTGNKRPQQQRIVVVGDPHILAGTARDMGVTAEFRVWKPGDRFPSGVVPVFSVSQLRYDSARWGQPDQSTGAATAQYIEAAVRLTLDGHTSALVTCPISKYSLHLAGYPFPGHTEMLASLTGTSRYRMMMAGSRLKVILVTIHEPLEKVPSLLTQSSVIDCIAMTVDALTRDFGMSRPRVAVAALNPHGGEKNMFGDQEQHIIAPAVEASRNLAEVTGPWPPDTVFHMAAAGHFDAVVAMYHDQGLIPFKLLHFEDGVNVTLGLPLVRTSVDHGTAYDIAGRWKADPRSLTAAMDMADEIVGHRRRFQQRQG